MKKLNLFFIAFAMFLVTSVASYAQSTGYGLVYNSDFSVAGTDTLTSDWIWTGYYPNIELGFAVSDSTIFEVTVYYQAGKSTSEYATVTADTLSALTDGGGFVAKVLRNTYDTNLIPGATYIKVRVVRIATKDANTSATSVSLQGRAIFRN